MHGYAFNIHIKKLNDDFFVSKLAFWLTTICLKGKIEMFMVSILLPTIIACVEKLDEKDDIIMACVMFLFSLCCHHYVSPMSLHSLHV